MTAEIVKFPYSASRRVHSKKPRRSKNGTPEERAAAAGPLKAPADVVLMSDAREDARSEVDGRKLRSSPLRDYIATVSFGATVVGKMHTAGLKGQPLAAFQPETRTEPAADTQPPPGTGSRSPTPTSSSWGRWMSRVTCPRRRS